GWRLKCIEAVQPVLAGPTGREGSPPTLLRRVDQSCTATKSRCQDLPMSRQLGGLPVQVGQKIDVAGTTCRDVGLEDPGAGQAQRALDIESFIALLSDEGQNSNAS